MIKPGGWQVLPVLNSVRLSIVQALLYRYQTEEEESILNAILVAADNKVYHLKQLKNELVEVENFGGHVIKSLAQTPDNHSDEGWPRDGKLLALTEKGNLMISSYGDKIALRFYHLTNVVDIVDVKCGQDHALLLNSHNKMFTFSMKDHVGTLVALKEVEVEEEKWKSIACGWCFNLALTHDGSVYLWMQWNDPKRYKFLIINYTTPRKITSLQNIQKMVCGNTFALFLDDNRKVFSFGENGEGQLGIGDRDAQLYPVQIRTLDVEKVTDIAASQRCAVAACTTENNTQYAWGKVKGAVVSVPTIMPKLRSIHGAFYSFPYFIQFEVPTDFLLHVNLREDHQDGEEAVYQIYGY